MVRARSGAISIALLVAALSSMCGAFEAELGARFADVYTAFAPLFLFHRSYADHLFLGTEIETPIRLVESCQSFSYQLARLQIDLIEQTASQMPQTMDLILRLRMEQAAYCNRHSPTIAEVAAAPEVDLEMLDAASDFGLFSGIQALGDLLEVALDAALGELEEELGPWRFAVAFSVRGIVNQYPVERIDANLRGILYGAEGAMGPPLPVPDAIADAMAGLIELSGRDLGEEYAALAAGFAAIVYRFLIEDEQETVP